MTIVSSNFGYKSYPNVIKEGEINIDGLICSGFSTNSYCYTPMDINFQDASLWEIQLKVKQDKKISSQATIFTLDNTRYGYDAIEIWSKKNNLILVLRKSETGDSIGTLSINFVYNKWFYIKINFDGSLYKLFTSEDEINWIPQGEIESSEKIINSSSIIFGVRNLLTAGSNQYPNSELSIDLSKCYIKLNDEIIWDGIKKELNTLKDVYTCYRKDGKLYNKRVLQINNGSNIVYKKGT